MAAVERNGRAVPTIPGLRSPQLPTRHPARSAFASLIGQRVRMVRVGLASDSSIYEQDDPLHGLPRPAPARLRDCSGGAEAADFFSLSLVFYFHFTT